MKKTIEDIDFDKIDYSKYKDEIEELRKDLLKIKKNRRLQRMIKKYKKKADK